ncbi:MAG TPA: T3SS effector HopA1 family protein [Bacteroidia bacterium]|nr:T3SS effector HopA1 family protein [Bacteroidia bacterium]HNU33376.1 T3SS effector HopA1 family protein [Bacteroidia bacterium]
MSKKLKAIIETIVASFDCDNNKSVFYKEQLVGALNDSQPAKNKLVNALMDIIYRDFYCATKEKLKKNTTDDLFFQSLVNATKPEQTINHGWKNIELEATGSAYLQKQNRIINAEPGNYINEYDNKYANNSGYAGVVVNPSFNKKDAYFFYVTGKTPNSGNIPIIRFYFNIKPNGATTLIQSIKEHFNRFGVPFIFKCCAKPAYYNRTDTAVLYIDYNLFSIAIQLLQKVIGDVKVFLNKNVPLFTYKISNGFSFAENPQGNLSFGQSRSNVIAAGIVDAMLEGKNKNDFADFVLECFNRDGFNTNKPYLNPSSTICYNFSLGGFKND